MAKLGITFAVFLLGSGLGARASAQEIQLTGPLSGACPAVAWWMQVPATWEWAFWVSGGVAVQGRGDEIVTFPAGFVGAELTTGVSQWDGFPAPGLPEDRRARPTEAWRRNQAELRLGGWLVASARESGGLFEGGATAHFGTTSQSLRNLVHAALGGMFDLRIGFGHGAFAESRGPHVTAAIAWGYRWVFDRETRGGLCAPRPLPASLADATLVRLVTTLRVPTDLPAWEVVVALEISPTAPLFPFRLGRGSP